MVVILSTHNHHIGNIIPVAINTGVGKIQSFTGERPDFGAIVTYRWNPAFCF